MNRDFKYVLQDTMYLYIGAKYTYDEMMEAEDVPFKFQAIIAHYLMKEDIGGMSLEDHIKHMTGKDMSYLTFKQLKTKVKTAKQIYTLEEFLNMNQAEKETLFLEEISLNKFSLMGFSV